MKVYPSNGANVEHLKPEHTPGIETMRYYLQLNNDEKEEEFFASSQLLNFAVITSSDPTALGKYGNGVTTIDHEIRDLETATRDRWQILKLKIPSGFFENMSLIPSSLPVRVELTLASNANSLIQRRAATTGAGDPSATAGVANAVYQIDSTKTYLGV